MRRVIHIGFLLPALLILAGGCATKDWVRDLLGKKEAETDVRFQGVEGRVQRVEGMGFQIQKLEASVGEARSRADEAFARAEQVDGRLTRLWSNRHARDLADTVQVHFGFDRWDLNDTAQTALLSLVKELRENPKLVVDLEGYTDSVGTPEYNVGLSQRRVEAVRRYLVEKGIELPRIHSIGLGHLSDNGKPEEQAKNRRVTLKLMVPKD